MFYNCSLSILSVAGFEVSLLPTAIFSAHTGISTDIAFLDFSGGMKGILNSWESLELTYDAVLIGYAFGKKQLEILTDFLGKKKQKIMELLIILYGKYRKNVIITGIEAVDNKLMVMAIDDSGDIYKYETEKINRNYSGTGDVYAAILLDGLLKDRDFQTSVKEAMELTTRAVMLSTAGNYEKLYFEGILKEL